MCLLTSISRGDRSLCGRGVRVLVLTIVAVCWNLATGGQPQHATPAASESFQQLADGASAALESNQIPQAIHLYQRATALQPSWSEGWWYLGTLFSDSSQFIQARDAFEHFISAERKQAGPGFGMLGLTEFKLHDYRRALDALERGRELGLGDNADFVHTALYHDGILNNFFGK